MERNLITNQRIGKKRERANGSQTLQCDYRWFEWCCVWKDEIQVSEEGLTFPELMELFAIMKKSE